ncbi:MAG: PQQ-like beta-propeller repeat protein [Actinobacteria bacterium]|nr:PQQ-like beta-propeller repeat protein [Actinomycetota bacterium]
MRDPIPVPHAPRPLTELARRLWAASLVALLALAPAGVSSAKETPAPGPWPQFQGDPGHSGVAPDGPAPPYRQVWKFSFTPKKGEGLSAPVIDGTTVISVGPDAVYGVDLETGTQLWSVPRDGPPAPAAVAEAGGTTLLLFTDGGDAETSKLRAIDLATRKEAWDVPLDSVSRSGVTVDGDHAFVGDAGGNVSAIDVVAGALDWSVAVGGEAKGPLAAAGGKVFVVPLSHEFKDSVTATVVALDAATGERVWSYAPRPPSSFASLASAADGEVVVASPGSIGDSQVRGLSADSGSELWSGRIGSVVFPFVAPAVAGEAVYVADGTGGVHAIDRSTGRQAWLFQLNERVVRGSPVVVGDHVLLGLSDGTLAAVDATTGHLVWRSPPAPGLIGPLAVTADTIVALQGGGKGGLVAFAHDDAGTLVDLESPTVPRYGAIIGRFALAFVAVGAAILVPLTLVARRVGPTDFGEPDGDDEDDALADDDGDEP